MKDRRIPTRAPTCVLIALAATLAAAVPAQATDYDLTLLNVIGPGGGQAFGIDRGHIVGAANGGALWPTPDQRIDLGFRASTALGIWGIQQVGVAANPQTNDSNAMLWTGSSDSGLNLNPSGSLASVANAVYRGVQVGAAGADHAYLWRGTAASATDLNPVGSQHSGAFGVWGDEAVGFAGPSIGQYHAFAWPGLAASLAVDIGPAGAGLSKALGVSHGHIVGWAGINGGTHAVLWDTPSPDSFHDLNPIGATASQMLGTNGTQQVGDISTDPITDFGGPFDHHAAVWRGTGASFQLLPTPSPYNFSTATGIDLEGNISGYVGVEKNGGVGATEPVLWTPHRLAGDANFDGAVNFADLLVLAQSYGRPGGWVDGDFTGDGTVGFGDLLTLAQHYGQSQPAGVTYSIATVPEPAAVCLITLMLLLPVRRTGG